MSMTRPVEALGDLCSFLADKSKALDYRMCSKPYGYISPLSRSFSNTYTIHRNIASLGAFITLLTLAVDPFSQASVSIGLCNRNLPHSASIPRSMNYSTYVRTGPGTGYPVSSMQFAILTGLFSPAPNSSIAMSNAVQCPTGNCTFGTPESNIAFSSLTMCHSCRDISGSIINDTENGRILLGEKFNSVEVSSITKDDFIPGPIFNMTVATGELQEPFADGEWQRTSMMNIIGLGYSNGRYTNSTSSSGSKYPLIAFECGLRPCVKSFSASVSKGVYMEEELSRQYLHQIHFNGGAPFFETAVDTAVINGTFIKCIPQSQMSETHTVQVLPLEAQVPYSGKPILLADLWLPRQCKHEIELGPLNSMSQYIDSLVSFASILSQPGNQRSGPGWLLRLWNQGNITIDSVNKFMGELASSIGAELRKNGDPVYNTALTAKEEYWTVARGDAQYMEPCIRVRWPFLSFLAALLVLEIIFFTATIIIHYRHHWFLDWKSATLPLLFQNIKGINESEKESTETENEEQQYSTEYYEMAKSTVAKLTMVDGQWEFTSKSEEDKDDL